MHEQDPHRRGRAEPRILYWFRTPSGVRVGRVPLDEAAMKLIEEKHPDIRFDWSRILKGDGEDAAPASLPARPPRTAEARREKPAQPMREGARRRRSRDRPRPPEVTPQPAAAPELPDEDGLLPAPEEEEDPRKVPDD